MLDKREDRSRGAQRFMRTHAGRVCRFRVIGDPVGHSLSPIMQRAALAHLALPHEYDAERVTHEQLPAFLDRLRRGELHGANVTLPHKVSVLSLLDLYTDQAA